MDPVLIGVIVFVLVVGLGVVVFNGKGDSKSQVRKQPSYPTTAATAEPKTDTTKSLGESGTVLSPVKELPEKANEKAVAATSKPKKELPEQANEKATEARAKPKPAKAKATAPAKKPSAKASAKAKAATSKPKPTKKAKATDPAKGKAKK